MDKDRLHFLIKRHLAGGLRKEELSELNGFGDAAIQQALNELLDDPACDLYNEVSDAAIPSERIYREILRHPQVAESISEPSKPRQWLRRPSTWWMGGAAAILCVGILLFSIDRTEEDPASESAASAVDPILPGGNKATLTLTDGSAIVLNEAQPEIIVSGDSITYGDGTQLVEEKQRTGDYLQLAAHRGGTYQITLSDGTKVWLNSDSKLRYPVQFAGNERIVELDGEAFFDVAEQQTPQGKRPFLVKTKSQTVEVLGTQFNISAYHDEFAEYTTLVEGAVQISKDAGMVQRLLPGQQGIVSKGPIQIKTVDVNVFTAWKDGYFAFPDVHIREVMKSIARWYDIEVEYQGDFVDSYFGGTISRFEDFETLLETIALTGSVKFKIIGRRVIVMA